MKNRYPLCILLLLMSSGLFMACETAETQAFTAVATSFKISHQGDEFNVGIGTTDIADTASRVMTTLQRKQSIGTTDIADTASAPIGTTDIADTASVIIGTTDIADMGGTIVLKDNSIISLTYNGTTFTLTTLRNLPTGAIKQHCFPLNAIIFAKDGNVTVKVDGQPDVNYSAVGKTVYIVREDGELCVYVK